MDYWQRRAEKTARETDGIPVTVREYPAWSFKVRPSNSWNPDWLAALARQAADPEAKALVARQSRDDYVPNAADRATDRKLMARAFTSGCLAGWSGVTGRDGAPLEYTPENALRLFEHFPDILRALRVAADNDSNFEPPSDEEKAAAIEGNLQPASGSVSDRGGKSRKR